MRPRSYPPASKRAWIFTIVAVTLALAGSPSRAENAVVPDLPVPVEALGVKSNTLHLEVFINGRDINAVAEVMRGDDGVFSARRDELRQAGLLPPPGPADEWVRFDQLPGLAYRYDQATQSIYFDAPEPLLAPHVYSVGTRDAPSGKATSAYGAVLNYDAFTSSAAISAGHPIGFGGGSLTLDGRAFSPFGELSSSGIFGTTTTSPATALRLDTKFTYFDEDRLMTYHVGDFVNSSLAWTRPIRMGGIQVSHDYAMRPDVVTAPVANISGSAAAPTSVDVYLNNFRVFTQEVDPGPYRIENLPIVGGNGQATLVLHDVNGNETTQTVPFFSSTRMLRPETFDYSAEAGYARTFYGEESFSYMPKLIGSASFRGGLTDWMTLEAHTEDGGGMINGGAGFTLNAFQHGVFDAALAGSQYQGARGLQLALGAATAIGGATIDVSSQRTFGPYGDLAQVTTPTGGQNVGSSILQQVSSGGVFVSPWLLSTSVAPPKALDRITFGWPNVLDAASLNLTFVNQEQSNGQRARIASLGLSHSFANGASVFATAYVDFANRNDSGIFFGLSWTFDNQISATTQYARQGGESTVGTQIAKTAGQEAGSYGWRVNDSEGGNRYTEASASYVTPIGKATATANQYGWGKNASALGTAEFTGSIATLGGAVAMAPAIPDAFTMVDAGAPGVTVLEDNRVVGKTDWWGRLLVTGLRGFEDNKISIDPATLPLSAQASLTETNLRPLAGSGVVADFKVVADARDAEIILTDAAGAPLPAGGRVEYSGGPPAIVGYDGRAYLLHLSPHNAVTVHADSKTCSAEFDYASPSGAARPTIGPIKCLAADDPAK